MKEEFSDGVVSIRRYRLDDVDAVFQAARESKNELSPWMPWCGPEYAVEDSKAFVSTRDFEWAKGSEFDFAIWDARSGGYLGGVGLNAVNQKDHFANLGYWVRSSRTGQGIAPAGARLVAKFGFEELKFARLEIVAAVGNQRSQRVAEKIGATREGVLRNRLTLGGKQVDAVMYSLIPEDLRSGR
jgi:ribosomal-protein-serine acetyltransferase